MLGNVTSVPTTLASGPGATAQASEASSSVVLEPTAMSSGRALNSRAAAACNPSKTDSSAASSNVRVPFSVRSLNQSVVDYSAPLYIRHTEAVLR